MDKVLCDIELSQGSMEDSTPPTPLFSAAPPQEYTGDSAIIACFCAILDQGLERENKRITTDLKHEFQELGTRIGTIESKLDETIDRTNQNTNCIEEVQLEEALNMIDDSEIRSCCYNFRVRHIPDSMAVSNELISHSLLYLPSHKLELDRAHRALTEPRPD